MNLTYEDIADYIISKANDSESLITNLKLNKLVYYCQAWHLAINNKPLFNEDFEAWIHGPVIRSLYRKYKEFGYKPIDKPFSKKQKKELNSKIPDDVHDFLEECLQEYMPCDAFELELMTHRERPWIDARKGLDPDKRSDEIITKKSMREYYASL